MTLGGLLTSKSRPKLTTKYITNKDQLVHAEHHMVPQNMFGGSDREFESPNYAIITTPCQECDYVIFPPDSKSLPSLDLGTKHGKKLPNRLARKREIYAAMQSPASLCAALNASLHELGIEYSRATPPASNLYYA